MAITLTWSLVTQHVWEDFYITYRASKNLALGHGLTFTPGERVHSFTSPLGTILPAVASLLTANSSDTAALWIFRLMCITAYAAAGAMLWRLLRDLFPTRIWPAVFAIAVLATDAKTVDYVTNGMETAFLILFFTWTFHALFLGPRNRWKQLGCAWAGLMWSRPDSFIYIGALAVGALLFASARPFWATRWEMLKTFLRAGAVTTALYAPWLLWAWWYYGTPVPHTIIAKGLQMPKPTPAHLLQWIIDFPGHIASTGGRLGATFMPPYALHTGWPEWAIAISFWVSLVAMLVWLVPMIRWPARVASFGILVGQFYLNNLSNYHAPWYLPTLALLSIVALAGLLDCVMRGFRFPRPDADTTRRPAFAGVAMLVSLPLIAGSLALLVCAAQQMRHSQSICEANRRQVGEWLNANASSPRDTVFLECLGYIGYYSNLKIYDFPGLGSPEMVQARRRANLHGFYDEQFADLIQDLEPEWVVLRATEAQKVRLMARDLLSKYYKLQKVFDVRDQVAAVKFLPGRAYLIFDAYFEIYRRDRSQAGLRQHNPVRLRLLNVGDLIVKETWAGPAYDSNGHIAAHSPSRLTVAVPAGATVVSGRFGFFPGAYENFQHSTPGGVFRITALGKDGRRAIIYEATLNPRENHAHRGDQEFSANFPAWEITELEFVTEPPQGQNNAFGWTYWKGLTIGTPRD